MSRGTHRQAQPSRHSPDAILLYTALGLLALACAGVYGATHIAAWLTGTPARAESMAANWNSGRSAVGQGSIR